MKKWSRRLGVLALSEASGLVLAELGYRAVLFSDVEAFESWRKPELDPASEHGWSRSNGLVVTPGAIELAAPDSNQEKE